MSTEALQAAEAAPAPEPTLAPSKLELAAAKLAARRAPPAEAPDLPPPDALPPPPAQAEQAPDPDALPSLDDLEPILRKRFDERQQTEAKSAERAELEALRAKVAELEQSNSAAPSIEAVLRLPAEERKAWLQQAARSLMRPDVAALERKIEQHKPGIDAEAVQKIVADALAGHTEAQREAEVRQQFIALAQSTTRPLSSREDPQEVVEIGDQLARRYQAAGYHPTLEQIADAVEAHLRSRVERLTGGALTQQVPQGAATARAEQAGAAGSQGGPASISNDLVASAQASRPRTHADRVALAAQKLKARRRSG